MDAGSDIQVNYVICSRSAVTLVDGKVVSRLSHTTDFIIEKARLSLGRWCHWTVGSNYTGEIHSSLVVKMHRNSSLLPSCSRHPEVEKRERTEWSGKRKDVCF